MLCLAGCNKELDRAGEAGITVNATIGNLTKVSYQGNATSFTEGDKIIVYGWTGTADAVPVNRVVNGVVNTLGADGKWTPQDKMIWQSSTGKHYFLGVYPARTIGDFKMASFKLNPSNFTESDILIATNLGGVTSKDGAVDLEFRHAMAKMVVNLRFGTEWESVPAVSKVSVAAKTGAEINYLDPHALYATGDASDINLVALASAPDGFSYSYSGLQVPQEGVRRITVVVNDEEYLYGAPVDIPLESGKITTIELAVKGRALVEAGSVTISDWADGTGLPGGAAVIDQGDQINFATNNKSMESALIANPNVNIFPDNIITKYEASLVTSLEVLFGDKLYNGANYNSFDEFQYFTGITTIPEGSFKGWNNLTSITLPESITKIKGGGRSEGPFVDCPKLESIKGKFTVDDKMIVFDGKLLKVAETATSITIPDGVERIGRKAFYKSNVEEITIPASVRVIGDNAFEYSQVEYVKFAMNGTDFATATSNVDSLAENSFAHCFRLTGFDGPEKGTSTVRVTPDNMCLCRDTTLYAFAMGSGLTEYVIPESANVHRLAADVFSAKSFSYSSAYPSAVQWKKIGLPSTLTDIGDHAFSAQEANMQVWFKGENPPKVVAGAFDDVSKITFFVPAVKKNDGTVDTEASNQRISQFKQVLGPYANCISYDDWPFVSTP